MAEVQTSTQSGELSQKFIEFVMMQAQQASLFLGRLPNPQSGKAEVLLDPAKLFIDQLEMIREKTRGNLTSQETEILSSVLSDLQMAFVQASLAAKSSPSTGTTSSTEESGKPQEEKPQEEKSQEEAAAASTETEGKKKFSKSYGS
jgi:hypothetical protein